MATFPSGTGQITLARMVAGESVNVAGLFVYSEWTFPNPAQILPADTVVHFLVSPHRIRFFGSFAAPLTYTWAYRVSIATPSPGAPTGVAVVGQFNNVEADFYQPPTSPTTGLVTFALNLTPQGTDPTTGTSENIFIDKVGGNAVLQRNMLTFPAGITTILAENILAVGGPIDHVTNQWH